MHVLGRQADLSKLPYQDTGHPINQPSVLTHVDFTESSAPKILENYFGKEAAAELKQKPWAIIQVRPLRLLSCLQQGIQNRQPETYQSMSCLTCSVSVCVGTLCL